MVTYKCSSKKNQTRAIIYIFLTQDQANTRITRKPSFSPKHCITVSFLERTSLKKLKFQKCSIFPLSIHSQCTQNRFPLQTVSTFASRKVMRSKKDLNVEMLFVQNAKFSIEKKCDRHCRKFMLRSWELGGKLRQYIMFRDL